MSVATAASAAIAAVTVDGSHKSIVDSIVVFHHSAISGLIAIALSKFSQKSLPTTARICTEGTASAVQSVVLIC